MSQPPARRGSRERKLPKYLQHESEIRLPNENRQLEPKDGPSNGQDIAQLAKLLVKFVSSSNTKIRDIQREDRPQQSSLVNEIENQRSFNNLGQEGKINNNESIVRQVHGPNSRHTGDCDQSFNLTVRNGAKPNPKKAEPTKKQESRMSGIMANDLLYHSSLARHVLKNLPGKSQSREAILKLSLPPDEQIDKQRQRQVDRKKLRSHAGNRNTQQAGGRQIKQIKPFVRQSYHVAIAYYIFLRPVQNLANVSPQNIDPTYNARKLREQNQRL